MPGGNKSSYGLEQTCSSKLQVCLCTYDLLLPPGTKGLTERYDSLEDTSFKIVPFYSMHCELNLAFSIFNYKCFK